MLVRFFVFLALKIPYLALKTTWMGARTDGVPDKLAQVWTEPTLDVLFQMPQSDGALHFGAVVIGVFVFILLGMMISFIPSFLLSSQTVIYFLLRRIVDFKDFDQVYLEEEQQKESGLSRLEKVESTQVEPEPAAGDDEAAKADDA